MALLLTVIAVALVFEYINGFHDTANSIATVVSTKVLTPRQAVLLAASMNLLGAMWGTAVAKTISSGLVDGFLFMAILYLVLQHARPTAVNRFFGRAQMFSAGAMGFMHGTNDAQKTMGIIALTLLGATKAGQLSGLPGWLSFLHTPEPLPGRDMGIAVWIKVTCALVMAAGTAVGGWRIIKTLGHKMVKLHPINGFAAEASSATVIFAATHLGIP